MNLSHFVRNLKRKLLGLNSCAVFKIIFVSMIVVLIVTVICFFTNLANSRYLMSVFNIVTFSVIAYHTLLMSNAIKKKRFDRKIIIKLCIAISSLATYLLCPLYIIMAIIYDQIDFVFPIGLCAMMNHFLILPAARNWDKKA